MRTYYEDNSVTLYQGDALSVLKTLPDGIASMAMCSPPYYSQRRYLGEPLVFGGDDKCQHEWGEEIKRQGHKENETNPGKTAYIKDAGGGTTTSKGNFCIKCGAWRGQLGLEPNPDCGRPYLELRDDLTPRQLEYVLGELKKCGLI